MKKYITALLPIVVICGFALFLWPIFSVSRPSWPEISEANKKDLISVIQDWRTRNLEGEIQKRDWPVSLSDLKPQFVYFDGRQIEIIISGGGIGPGWGYFVTETGTPDSKGLILIKSKDARFQKFRQRQ